MKIIRVGADITIILDDGVILSHSNCTDEMYNDILKNQNDESYVKRLIAPELSKEIETYKAKKHALDKANINSKYLSVVGSSVYIKSISELTLPEDLVNAFLEAEEIEDQSLIDTYLNFWTLCSLNLDSRARTNLFWFLNKYGMSISKSGLFVAYRNVKIKKQGLDLTQDQVKYLTDSYFKTKNIWKKSAKNYHVGYNEEGELVSVKSTSKLKKVLSTLQEMYDKLSEESYSTVYTDSYTRKFNISLGKVVTIPRDQCDPVQENTCSRGLHVAGKDWLSRNYFGNISLMVLVNPADVVAVPPSDSYGKMRTCAYYPVKIVEFNEDGKIQDNIIEDGFEDDFMNQICYQGDISDEDGLDYTVSIPNCPEIKSQIIIDNLDRIKNNLSKKIV